MASIPILQLPQPVVVGDTWPGMALTMKDDGVDVNLTDAEIIIELYLNGTKTIIFKTNAENVGEYPITITDASHGKFEIDGIDSLELAAGNHVGHLKMTYPDGDIVTYCQIQLIVTLAR